MVSQELFEKAKIMVRATYAIRKKNVGDVFDLKTLIGGKEWVKHLDLRKDLGRIFYKLYKNGYYPTIKFMQKDNNVAEYEKINACGDISITNFNIFPNKENKEKVEKVEEVEEVEDVEVEKEKEEIDIIKLLLYLIQETDKLNVCKIFTITEIIKINIPINIKKDLGELFFLLVISNEITSVKPIDNTDPQGYEKI